MRRESILAVVFLCLISVPLLAASYLGYNTIGANPTVQSSIQLRAIGPFTASQDGTATRIEFYTSTGGGFDVTFGIYADSMSYPGAVLRQTAGGAINGGSGTDDWRGQDLTAPYSLVSGTKYWIVMNSQSGASYDIFYDILSPGNYFIDHAYSAGALTDPFPASATSNPATISARIVYDATGPGGGGGHRDLMLGVH